MFVCLRIIKSESLLSKLQTVGSDTHPNKELASEQPVPRVLGIVFLVRV
jgi:hypothetical protein